MPAPPHDATGHTRHHADRQFFTITKLGVSAIVPGCDSDMPGFEAVLTDAEITAVLAFVKSTWPARPVEQRGCGTGPMGRQSHAGTRPAGAGPHRRSLQRKAGDSDIPLPHIPVPRPLGGHRNVLLDAGFVCGVWTGRMKMRRRVGPGLDDATRLAVVCRVAGPAGMVCRSCATR